MVKPYSQETEEEIMNRLMVTEESVSVKIKNLKNRKASEVDDIPKELIKYGGKELETKLPRHGRDYTRWRIENETQPITGNPLTF